MHFFSLLFAIAFIVATVTLGVDSAFTYYVCNDPCRTGGAVDTCCRAHGFGGGWCEGNIAVCQH